MARFPRKVSVLFPLVMDPQSVSNYTSPLIEYQESNNHKETQMIMQSFIKKHMCLSFGYGWKVTYSID